jgi:pimeloyl-ACP methyl ester carboxylesterase
MAQKYLNKKVFKKTIFILSGGLLGLLLIGLGLVYLYLPTRVAESIIAESKIRKPIEVLPGKYDLKYQSVTFETSDHIKIVGWWIPSMKRGYPLGTIIMSHGLGHNRDQMLSRAAFLSKAGYQILLFDLRGNGESQYFPLSGGVFEAKDFSGALKFLKKIHKNQAPIIYFGLSLSAMAALRSAVHHPSVKGVIADSPLPNIQSFVAHKRWVGWIVYLPYFLRQCLSIYDQKTGLPLRLREFNLCNVVKQLRHTPVLYFVGEEDQLISSRAIRHLFNCTACPHRQLVFVPNAQHAKTFNAFKMIYEKIVLNFLNEIKKGFPKNKFI